MQKMLAEILQAIKQIEKWDDVSDQQLKEKSAAAYQGTDAVSGWKILAVTYQANGVQCADGTAVRAEVMVHLTRELAEQAVRFARRGRL